MTRYTLFGVLALLIVAATPFSSSAYTTSDQQAHRISERAAFFTITYRFGIPNRDFYLPIKAIRDLEAGSDEFAVGFEMLEDGKEPLQNGLANGIVLSNAKVVGDSYFVPAGQSRTFTLFVLLTTDENEPEKDYALHLHWLPFTGVVDGQELNQRLNPSELQYYITPEVELNESNGN